MNDAQRDEAQRLLRNALDVAEDDLSPLQNLIALEPIIDDAADLDLLNRLAAMARTHIRVSWEQNLVLWDQLDDFEGEPRRLLLATYRDNQKQIRVATGVLARVIHKGATEEPGDFEIRA